ncbi:hypothetical protein B4U79_17590 [Dinothrombium tinctorium]|uniref:Uncharacterized protein n=1 Tax=Dinothrombium tinctorium TaxID=1965070 RepID=A0A3S3NWT2_9ACAR|nr:hypothetical protein B4U79_16873 [Dinothrombium tinctorium]RWS03600.1 hypothetical protein B4U79_16497 [Dinothrombium tinctorium]RWS10636.1 hypothetical protein B4U79_17590 [Dinothrombium tinctorium]
MFIKLFALQLYFSTSLKAESIDSYCDDAYIDAIMWSFRKNQTENDVIFVFRGQHFWKYNLKTRNLWDERLIKHVWPDVKLPITAISGIQTGYTVGRTDCDRIIIVSQFTFWTYDCKEEYERNQTLRSTGIIIYEQKTKAIEALVVSKNIKSQNEVYFCDGTECLQCPAKIANETLHISKGERGEKLCFFDGLTDFCECKYLKDTIGWNTLDAASIFQSFNPYKLNIIATLGNKMRLLETRKLPIRPPFDTKYNYIVSKDVFGCKKSLKFSLIILLVLFSLIALVLVAALFSWYFYESKEEFNYRATNTSTRVTANGLKPSAVKQNAKV